MRNGKMVLKAVGGLLWIITLAVVPEAVADASHCATMLPADATSVGAPRLCRDDGQVSVCQLYGNERQQFVLIFRGGKLPLKVVEQTDAIESSPAQSPDVAGQCEPARPSGVPAAAKFLGTGVCSDDNGQPLPCQAFEHAGARQRDVLLYLAQFQGDGGGLQRLDVIPIALNEHAGEAVLAHALGLALAERSCCAERAQAYLARAAALFPDDEQYRVALIRHQARSDVGRSSPLAAYERLFQQAH
jgi:hypothetical protein